MRPLSEVLVDFASPFFPLGWQRGPASSVQRILELAGIVWDATETGATAADICERFDHVTPEVAVMIEALVRRKQLFFAADARMMSA